MADTPRPFSRNSLRSSASTRSRSRIPLAMGCGAVTSASASASAPASSTTTGPPPPQWFAKHAALEDTAGLDLDTLTPSEWRNVNDRIRKTVEIILAHDHVVRGPGPGECVLTTASTGTGNTVGGNPLINQGKEKENEEKEKEKKKNLGVALVAEIAIRPIQRPCWLADAVVQEKIWSMARDPTHARFRHTYLNGRVWFFFRVTDLEVARRPMGVGEGDGDGDGEGEGEMLVEDGDGGGDWIIV